MIFQLILCVNGQINNNTSHQDQANQSIELVDILKQQLDNELQIQTGIQKTQQIDCNQLLQVLQNEQDEIQNEYDVLINNQKRMFLQITHMNNTFVDNQYKIQRDQLLGDSLKDKRCGYSEQFLDDLSTSKGIKSLIEIVIDLLNKESERLNGNKSDLLQQKEEQDHIDNLNLIEVKNEDTKQQQQELTSKLTRINEIFQFSQDEIQSDVSLIQKSSDEMEIQTNDIDTKAQAIQNVIEYLNKQLEIQIDDINEIMSGEIEITESIANSYTDIIIERETLENNNENIKKQLTVLNLDYEVILEKVSIGEKRLTNFQSQQRTTQQKCEEEKQIIINRLERISNEYESILDVERLLKQVLMKL